MTDLSTDHPATAPVSQAYRDGVLVAESFAIDEVATLAAQPGTVVWVDVPMPDGAATLHRLAGELGFSDLVVEDALSRHERPRVDSYDGYFFVNAYTTRRDPDTGQVETAEISAIVLPTVLVTVRAGTGLHLAELLGRWREQHHLLRHGPAALLYGLLDLVVDGHFATVQALDDEVEAIEDILFEERGQQLVHERTYLLRKSLVHLRRVVLPMREVVNELLRWDPDLVDAALRAHYQDLYDHVLRVTEWSESLRDMVTTIFETNLSLQDHRLNVVIKKLTSWAAIIAVPTAITGFFGQNVAFPGEGAWSGLALSVLLMAGSAVGLYVLFRNRDWI
jgi:magnesium transporter